VRERGVEDLPADVVEVDVDALRAVLAQRAAVVLRLVVDRRVEAEVLDDVRHFSGPPAMPTTRQPLIFAIWPTSPPTAPAAPETTTVSPALGLPTSSRPKYAVTPGMPERAQIHRQRREARVDLEHALAVCDRVLLHAEQPADVLADGHVRIVGGDHLAGGERAHDLADADRRDV
jgi:hypothetical protein